MTNLDLDLNLGTRAPAVAPPDPPAPPGPPVEGLVQIETFEFAGEATAEFTGFDATKYDAYFFQLSGVIPSVDDAPLWMRLSSDAGVSFDADAGNYEHVIYGRDQLDLNAEDTSAPEIELTLGVGSAANEQGVCGEVWMIGPDLAVYTIVSAIIGYTSNSGEPATVIRGGHRKDNAATNGAQFFFDGANIAEGIITMWGLAGS